MNETAHSHVKGVEDAQDEKIEDLVAQDIYVPGTREEKLLVWKIDRQLMPCIWLMYIFNYLDRTNIGNAQLAGMSHTLNMSSQDYDWALSIFFFGYVLFEVPSNLILARSKPSVFLPSIMILWGSLCCVMAAINNFAGLMALRFVLGCVEAGFAPGVLFLMSSWYTKAEQARRYAVYWSAAVVSGAFGGLLAGAITSGLDGVAGLEGWRWLFLIEGLCTVVVSLGAYKFLFNFPENTKGFSDDERRLLINRLAYDGQGDMNTESGNVTTITPIKAMTMAFMDWRLWGLVLTYSMTVGAGTISYYLPTLTQALGYDTVTAQYMTIPIYMVAVVFSLGGGISSDYFQDRKYHICAFTGLGFTASVIAANVLNSTVRYVMLCFMAAGIWSALPMVLTWTGNTIQWPREKRAVAFATVNALGNLSSVYGSRIWPDWDSPRHAIGFGVTAGFLGCAVSLSLVLGYLFEKFPHAAYVERQNDRSNPT
ncbi:major facilitator superfamily domain-containing protein [Aspergillus heterothallicus]